MNEARCEICCDYERINSGIGHCKDIPGGKTVVLANCRCERFVPGEFENRVETRRKHEEMMEKLKEALGNE